MRKYIYLSFIFFILVALTGVWMRYYQLSSMTFIPYDHLLHAHSHLALLGWIFIIAFIIFLASYWQVIEKRKQAHLILFSLVSVSFFMFLAFLYEGYGVFSIILSTLHIFIEYWAVIFIWKHLGKIQILKSAKAFIIYFIALFPNYLHSILWIELPTSGVVLSVIGSIGQWIGVMLIFIALKDVLKGLKDHYRPLTTGLILLSFGLLLVKSTMELGMIYPGLAELVNTTRSVIIGYLHLTLLGFISIFILALLQMRGLIKANRFSIYSFAIFLIGFSLNELLLFFDALGQWTLLYRISFFNESLLIAAILLSIGVIMITFTVDNQSKFG